MANKKLLLLLSICIILVFVILPLSIGCKSATTPTTSNPATSAPAVTTSAPATTAPAQVITLKALRPWPWELNDTMAYREFVQRVNDAGKGKVVIKDMGGAEVFPTTEQFKQLKLNAIDILYTSSGYIATDFPEPTSLMYGFGALPNDLKGPGSYWAKLDEIARKEHGVTMLANPMFVNAQVFLAKPIANLGELKMMKIRSHPSYDPLIKSIGITTVTVPSADIFTAMQTGVVNGYVTPDFAPTGLGLADVSKYRIDPPFYRAGWSPIMMNAKVYDALPKDVQQIITDVSMKLDKDMPDLLRPLAVKETADLKAKGMKIITISDAEWMEVQKTAWEKGLPAALLQVSPKYGQELINLLKPFYDKLKTPYPAVN